MTQLFINTLLIEGKQHVYDLIAKELEDFRLLFKEEYQKEKDAHEKEILERGIKLIEDIEDCTSRIYEQHILELRDRHVCSDTSTKYGANLRGWNSILSKFQSTFPDTLEKEAIGQ